MAESTSGDQFKILQREIRESIRRNHPNPDRIGCPGTPALRRMAEAAVPPSDPGYRHVMECSPCYEELMELTAAIQGARVEAAARRRRALTFSFGVAAVLFALGVYFVNQGAGPAAIGKKDSHPREKSGAHRFEVAMLNLDSETSLRGEGGERRRTELQRLPRNKLDLTVNLPRGLEEGMYEMELSRGDGVVTLVVKGAASLEDGLTVLHLQPDLSGLAAGQYHLRIRREGSAWRDSDVLLF